jgi:opacity protein-like surface antigen
MAGALVSPQAAAGSKAHHAEAGMSNKVDALEAELQAMRAEINSLKAAANRPADAGKVQELDQWMASVKSGKASVNAPKDHLFSARGGWMHFNDSRDSNTGTLSNANFSADQNAHYYGAAMDFNVNNDLFGLMEHTSFAMEFGAEYAQIGNSKPNGLGHQVATVNQLRINASPKVKFMHGSKFRPWLIPVGVEFNIVSPPSSAITVLNSGMQFGAGAEYELLRGIVIGADGRYHHTFQSIDGVNTDGFTLGGSVGFKF